MYTSIKDKINIKGLKKLIINKNNKAYLKQKERENKDLLDNICGYSLDKTQREIVLSEEDSTLVIASAGSGKSLTILGRVLYLIKNGVKPKDILLISFTNEACNNLKIKLKNCGVDINVLTFHKLGRNILKENGENVNLVPNKALEKIIDKIFKHTNFKYLIPDLKFKNIGGKDEYLERKITLISDEVINLKKLIVTFINLFKGHGYTEDMFNQFLNENYLKRNKEYRRNEKFLKLTKKIYLEYERYLYENKCIDFNDMISKSIKTIINNGIYPYKYILVDEYQDTSTLKCELLKTIKQKANSKILAVGDDYQSIYRFTGSDLEVFINFDKYFPHTKTFKLINTYRCSKGVMQIASRFIMKNKRQIPKKINTNNNSMSGITIYYYDKDYRHSIPKLLNEYKDPLILGRNNKDLIGINGNKKTIHKAKGLEADHVIVVGLSDKSLGFPNKIKNDDVLKFVITGKDYYPFEEERRLFYVALTRARKECCLMVDRKHPSSFVLELLRDNNNISILNDQKRCPKCNASLTIKFGKYGLFYGCENYPKCKYTSKID